MSHRDRKCAEENRRRRERQREHEEWLRANANNPAFLQVKAAIQHVLGVSPPLDLRERLRSYGEAIPELKPILECPKGDARPRGSRGPTFNPARLLRDIKVELLYRSARAAGWSHKAAIDLGAEEVRRSGTGASSPKLVEAIIAKHRLTPESKMLDVSQIEAKAREFWMRATVSSIKNNTTYS